MKVNRIAKWQRRSWFAGALVLAIVLGLAALFIARAYRSGGSTLTNPSAPGVEHIAEGLRSTGR